jgi:transglutaminase-like putative cysteine protease
VGSEARARLGLAALLAATLLSFGSVFSKSDYMGPTVLGVLLSIGMTLLCRRMGAGPLVTIAASVALLGWYLLIVFEGRHTFYGLPTLEAAAGVARAAGRAIQTSNLDFAPVPVRPGYVILTVVGMWLIATLGEVATFRWRRPLLASLPSIALFSFLLVIGRQSRTGFLLVVFIAALLTYWALESSHRLRSWGRWVGAWGDRPEAGHAVTGRVARRMGYSCVAAALVAPLVLPALGSGVLSWRNPTGTGAGPGAGAASSGNAISPFVDLRPKLLEQASEELFRVTAERPEYWRLLSLSDFDGERWTEAAAAESTVPPEGIIESPQPTAFERTLSQAFDLTNLEGPFVPAAGRPSSITFEGNPATTRFNAATRHLELDEGDVQGLRYTVTSKLPKVSFTELNRTAAGNQTDQVYTGVTPAIYTELPDDLSPEVEALARRWTDEETSDFSKLIALQNVFQTEFAYSEEVEVDDSEDYLTTFLTETRTGYCQQFSTAFAMLARTLGYPSRVSVGFLPGEAVAPDTYVVRGTDAHAWPEVYFEGYGWVRFEPTPRARTELPAYTVESSPAGGPGAGGDLGGAGNQGPGQGALGEAVRTANLDPGSRRPEQAGNQAPTSYAWQETFARLARGLALGVLIFLLLVPLLKELEIRYRYRRATSPSSATAAAFAQFLDEAGELAGPRKPSESAVAYALRLVAGGRVAAEPAVRLATLFEIAEYSPAGVSSGQAREARRLARRLRSLLWARASWLKRASLLFSPVRLRPSLRLKPSR